MPSSSSIALITIKQRHTMLPQARYEAAINNKCHSLYVALVSSIFVVILVYFVHQAHMDVLFAPPIHVFLPRSLVTTAPSVL